MNNKKRILIIIIFDIIVLPLITSVLYIRKGQIGFSEIIALIVTAVLLIPINIYLIKKKKG